MVALGDFLSPMFRRGVLSLEALLSPYGYRMVIPASDHPLSSFHSQGLNETGSMSGYSNSFFRASQRELYSNNISGPIPNDLGNLTNLVSLELYLNNFSYQIPEALGKLSKLRFLATPLQGSKLFHSHMSTRAPSKAFRFVTF